MPGHGPVKIDLVQWRERSHDRGIPDPTSRPIARSTPDRRQGKPQTKERTCDEPANKSLLTDVSKAALLPLHDHRIDNLWTEPRAEDGCLRLVSLTGDIRGWVERMHLHARYPS